MKEPENGSPDMPVSDETINGGDSKCPDNVVPFPFHLIKKSSPEAHTDNSGTITRIRDTYQECIEMLDETQQQVIQSIRTLIELGALDPADFVKINGRMHAITKDGPVLLTKYLESYIIS